MLALCAAPPCICAAGHTFSTTPEMETVFGTFLVKVDENAGNTRMDKADTMATFKWLVSEDYW